MPYLIDCAQRRLSASKAQVPEASIAISHGEDSTVQRWMRNRMETVGFQYHSLRQWPRSQHSLRDRGCAEKPKSGGHSRANLRTAPRTKRPEIRSLVHSFSKAHDFADLVRFSQATEVEPLSSIAVDSGWKVLAGQRVRPTSNLRPLIIRSGSAIEGLPLRIRAISRLGMSILGGAAMCCRLYLRACRVVSRLL